MAEKKGLWVWNLTMSWELALPLGEGQAPGPLTCSASAARPGAAADLSHNGRGTPSFPTAEGCKLGGSTPEPPTLSWFQRPGVQNRGICRTSLPARALGHPSLLLSASSVQRGP